MIIGEFKYVFFDWIKDVLVENMVGFNKYLFNDGLLEFLVLIVDWID